MFVAVRRNCVGSACKFHLISALGHDFVTCFDAGKDLHLLAVIGSESDELLFVSFLIHLQIYEETALFFGQSCMGSEITFSIGEESRNISTKEPGMTSPLLSNSKVTGT